MSRHGRSQCKGDSSLCRLSGGNRIWRKSLANVTNAKKTKVFTVKKRMVRTETRTETKVKCLVPCNGKYSADYGQLIYDAKTFGIQDRFQFLAIRSTMYERQTDTSRFSPGATMSDSSFWSLEMTGSSWSGLKNVTWSGLPQQLRRVISP